MLDPGQLPSPFPVRDSRIRVYATASELLGRRIDKKDRVELWKQVASEQALSLIAQIVTDIEVSATLDDVTLADVDQKWAARVSGARLRTSLGVVSKLGATLFAPQLLLLAAEEVLWHCPDGPPADTLEGLDILILCLLSIGDDDPVPVGETWGGVDVALAGEIIANLYFNRPMWAGHQLSWFERTWFQDWPKRTAATETVGGEPRELFKEATGIDLADFAAVAFNVYAQSAIHMYVRFPAAFFETLGLEPKAIEHFLNTTARTVPELRDAIQADSSAVGSRYRFDVFRRFPLVRLASGEVLVLSPNFVIQRALSEVIFWDVRNYLKEFDQKNGTKRDQAFHLCTTDILEHEAGVTLRRIFARSKIQVLDEKHLQKRFASRGRTPSVCDYAVRAGRTWLLIEVTDRAMPRPVVLANTHAAALDAELGKLLTDRKAKQLASTISLLKTELETKDNQRRLSFIPLVVTGQTALPWNPTVHLRTTERLGTLAELSEDSCTSVALITLKDLMILEHAASLGHDIIELLRSWRQSDPGSPLDQYLHQRGVPLSSPKWEKEQAFKAIRNFVKRMKTA